MSGFIRKDQRAFSLLEIIAALGILAIIFLLFFRFGKSFDEQNNVAETRMRMEEILKSAKAYYLKNGDLPRNEDDGGIPQVLNINPKIRFDGWQQPMRYISFTNDGDSTANRPGRILIDELSAGAPPGAPAAMVEIEEDTRTLIRAIEFEGQRVAGLLISYGPDAVPNYEITAGYPEVYRLEPGSDDIITPVDLKPEAVRIALSDLKLLNEKVKAFDDRYLGVNNNKEFEENQSLPLLYDEDGCEGIPYVVNSDPVPPQLIGTFENPLPNCDPLNSYLIENPGQSDFYPQEDGYGPFPPATNLDINCGRKSLDFMKASFCPSPFGRSACKFGYILPELTFLDVYRLGGLDDDGQPLPPVACAGNRSGQSPSYARIPFNINTTPSPDDCHWGLVETRYEQADENETDSDQARAFIFCLYNLNPDQIVDPWLNGYVWGCGSDVTYDIRSSNRRQQPGCQYTYLLDSPRYHRFFSAGPNGFPLRLEIELGLVEEDSQEGSDDIVP